MKKLVVITLALAGLSILAISCKDQKTYADYLKDEERAIDQYILKNDLSILKKFPDNGTFKAGDFYLDPETGVYYNIVSYGDTSRNISFGEEVYIRFSGLKYFSVDDSTSYSNMDTNNHPNPQTVVFRAPVNNDTKGYYDNPGWIVPLTRVGHNGVVRMIIPFNMGSSYDRSNFIPTYYDHIEYRFENSI